MVVLPNQIVREGSVLNQIRIAEDLLAPGDFALVVNTNGRLLQLNEDGNGSSGVWVVRACLDVNKFIIRKENSEGFADVLVSDFQSQTLAEHETFTGKRYTIHFSNLRNAGPTKSNWNIFASAGTNPVRYVHRRRDGRL